MDEIKEVANGVRIRRRPLFHLEETGDFNDSDFYGFCGDFEQNTGRWQLRIQEGAKHKEVELSIYNENTEDGKHRK